jgi:hypothetical protein
MENANEKRAAEMRHGFARGETRALQAIPWVQQHFGSASTFNAHDWLVRRFPALANHVPSQEQLVQNIGSANPHLCLKRALFPADPIDIPISR